MKIKVKLLYKLMQAVRMMQETRKYLLRHALDQ